MHIPSKIIEFHRHIRDFRHKVWPALLLIGVVLLVVIVFIAKGMYTRFQIQQAMNEADMRAIGRALCFYMVDYYPVDYYPNLSTCMDAARDADDKGWWGPPSGVNRGWNQ